MWKYQGPQYLTSGIWFIKTISAVWSVLGTRGSDDGTGTCWPAHSPSSYGFDQYPHDSRAFGRTLPQGSANIGTSSSALFLRRFVARLRFVFSKIGNLALYSQLFGKKVAISASIPFRHLPDLDESLNIWMRNCTGGWKIYILDENDTKFQMKKRFVATQATKIEVSSPIRLQPKYEEKSPDRLCLDFSLGAQFWTSELCCWWDELRLELLGCLNEPLATH
jgi:hypothetical protein